MRTSYSALMVELASNGYIVASLEHKDHTACARKRLHNKWTYFRFFDPTDDSDTIRRGQLLERVSDCQRVHQFIQDLNLGERKVLADTVYGVNGRNFLISLKDSINMDKVCLAGHSFGGTTVASASYLLKAQ
jgi:platelet-activating factor acetylhydrolase